VPGVTDRPLGSRYVLTEQIGRGATGTVWRGQVRDTGEPVAVKLLREDLTAEPDVVARFVQERAVLLRLRHPNLVRVHDLVTEGDMLALVMDLVEGTDLRQHLRARGTLPPSEAVGLLAEVADALAAAHAAGVVHRDLKPDNVLLDRGRDGILRVRLTDFGVARVLDNPGITTVAVVIGTPNYLAPELVNTDTPTPAVDVYALGIVLYELIVGRQPYAGGHPVTILRRHVDATPRRRPGIPDPVWEIIQACVQKDPALRPDAAELAGTLRRTAREIVGTPALEPLPRNSGPLATYVALGPGTEEEPDAPEPAPPAAAAPAGPRAAAGTGLTGPAGVPGLSAVTGLAGARTGRRPLGRPQLTLRGRRVVAGAAAFAGVVGVALLGPLLAQRSPFEGDANGETAALRAPLEPARPAGPTPAPTATVTVSAPPAQPQKAGRSNERQAPDGEPRRYPAETGGDAAPEPTARTTERAAKPKPKPKPAPAKPLTWHCASQFTWSSANGVGIKGCYATRGAVVYYRGQVSGRPGTAVTVLAALTDVDTDRAVAGPVSCAGLSFSNSGTVRTCGPFKVTAARGHRYVAVASWRLASGGAVRGTSRSPVFGW
jgi:serine/threonine-protein kinase